MAQRRIFLVVNPRAAAGAVAEQWPDLQQKLFLTLGAFDFRMTDAPQAATRLTREALKAGYDLVLSLGGDGTHNEVINGFFEDGKPICPHTALGILPFGTGGDFRKSLRLGEDLEDAAKRALEATPRPLDVGHLRFVDHDGNPAERYFLNIASFGISGLVDQMVNRASKSLGGKASFMLGAVRALAEYEPQKVRLQVGAQIDIQIDIQIIAVANGRFFGGGMKIAPHASIHDGLFDIAIVREMDLSELIKGGLRLYEGRLFESARASHLQAAALTASPVRPDDHILLDIDGEAPGRLPASFRVLPGAVPILY